VEEGVLRQEEEDQGAHDEQEVHGARVGEMRSA
jgi:hypothetical protein